MTTIMNLLKLALALAISLVATSSMANSLDQAQSIKTRPQFSRFCQKVIDKSSQATLMLQAGLSVRKKKGKLRNLSRSLAALVESQNQEAQSIEGQIDESNIHVKVLCL